MRDVTRFDNIIYAFEAPLVSPGLRVLWLQKDREGGPDDFNFYVYNNGDWRNILKGKWAAHGVLSVKAGTTEVLNFKANSKTPLCLNLKAGNNITLTANPTNNEIEISATGGSGGSNTFTVKAGTTDVVTFNPSGTTPQSVTFTAGSNISLTPDTETGNIQISASATDRSYEVSLKNDCVIYSPGASSTVEEAIKWLYEVITHSISGKTYNMFNIYDFYNHTSGPNPSDNYSMSDFVDFPSKSYKWTISQLLSGKCIGLLSYSSSAAIFNFIIKITDSGGVSEEHDVLFWGDTPPFATFTFITTCAWNFKCYKPSDYAFKCYIEIPAWFTGSVEVIPKKYLSGKARVTGDGYYSFCNGEPSHKWRATSLEEVGQVAINTTTITESEDLRIDTNPEFKGTKGKQYVDFSYNFGSVINVGDLVSASIVTDSLLYFLSKKVESNTNLIHRILELL